MRLVVGEKLDYPHFSGAANEDYVKFSQIDMAQFIIRGGLVSEWLASDSLDWSLKIHNPETKKYRQIPGLDGEELLSKGASKFSLRTHLSLESSQIPNITLR